MNTIARDSGIYYNFVWLLKLDIVNNISRAVSYTNNVSNTLHVLIGERRGNSSCCMDREIRRRKKTIFEIQLRPMFRGGAGFLFCMFLVNPDSRVMIFDFKIALTTRATSATNTAPLADIYVCGMSE